MRERSVIWPEVGVMEDTPLSQLPTTILLKLERHPSYQLGPLSDASEDEYRDAVRIELIIRAQGWR